VFVVFHCTPRQCLALHCIALHCMPRRSCSAYFIVTRDILTNLPRGVPGLQQLALSGFSWTTAPAGLRSLPVVIAGHFWGHRWSQQHILFRTGNEAVTAILNSSTSKVPCIMGRLRSLLFVAAKHNFTFSFEHLPGEPNTIADALPRFHWRVFHSMAPLARPSPTAIPGPILQQLLRIL